MNKFTMEDRRLLFNYFKEKPRAELVKLIIEWLTDDMREEILMHIKNQEIEK